MSGPVELEDQASKSKSKSIALTAIKLVTTAAIVYMAVQFVDANDILMKLNDVNIWLVVLAAMSACLDIPVAAYRWRYFLGIFRVKSTLLDCTRIYAEAVSFNLILPGTMGGEVYRTVLMGRRSNRYWSVISSVLGDRFASLFILLIVCGIFFFFQQQAQDPTRLVILILGAGFLLTFVLVYIVPIPRALMRNRLGQFYTRLVFIVRRMFRGPRRTAWVLILSALTKGTIFFAMYFSMLAVSPDLNNFGIAVIAVTIATLAATIPISFAGFGLREGAVVGTLYYFDVDTNTAVLVAAIFSFAIITQCLPGAISLLVGKIEQRSKVA